MAHKGVKPMCKRCSRYHYNYLPCDKVSPEPTIEWRQREGWHDWSDQVNGAPGLPVQGGGWGCNEILPSERNE